jgi:glycosyltransferase involved in cell wall biosynthesis
LKILHVTQGYWPARGGTELLIQRVSEELVSRFHDEVTVFTTDCYGGEAFFNRRLPRMPTGEETHHGVTVRRFHVESRLSGIVRRLQAPFWKYRLPGNERLRFIAQGPRIPGLRRHIEAFPADVIAASSFPLLHMFDALEGARRTKRPCVLHGGLHPDDAWGFQRKRIYEAIRESFYLANTSWEADYVISRGAPAERVFVVGCGVDVERFAGMSRDAARAALGLEPSAPTIGFIGQLAAHKGLDTLMGALPHVWKRVPDARVLIAGARTMYVPHLEAMIAALPHGERRRITVKYDFEDAEKPDLFSAIDVFAYPSGFESFGIAFVEAWAAGKPVVGCRRGAIPSLVTDGVDGLLVTWQDPGSLAEGLVTLLNDPARARQMGTAGKAKAYERYTWRRIGERFRNVYSIAAAAFA